MYIDKYNLLKDSFYTSTTSKSIVVDEMLEDSFIKSAREIEFINFDDCLVSLSNGNIVYKLLNSSINLEITISVSCDYVENDSVKFCYDIGTSQSSLINEMSLKTLVSMTNDLIDNMLNEKDNNKS